MNHIVGLLTHIANILTNQLIMTTGKSSTDVAYTIETNRLMMGNAITEFANMSEVFIDICLVLTFSFVREDLQKRLATSFVSFL